MSEASPRPPRPPSFEIVLVCVESEGAVDEALAQAIAEDLTLTRPRLSAVYGGPHASQQAAADLLCRRLSLPPATGDTATIEAHEGEAPEAAQERAWAALQALRERHGPEGAVAVIGSQAAIRSLVCRALLLPPTATDRFGLDEGSISVIEFRGQRTILAALNDHCHLQPA